MMRVLWITNIPLPPICKAIGMALPAVGGWMYSSLKRIVDSNACNQFAVATVYPGKLFVYKKVDNIDWYLLPLNGCSPFIYNKKLESYFERIYNQFNPDIVHIHGSEFPHSLAYVKACGNKGCIVSLQGILSVYARYYTLQDDPMASGISTFRDFIKCDSINKRKREFITRGKLECELLKSVNHIIGRTEWDKVHAWAINPKASYHYCGETLRDSFYNNTWEYCNCQPFSIFTSQGTYPIKGLHKMLEAMPYILRKYPKTILYIAGTDITGVPWYRISGYAKYLKRKMKILNIADHVVFTGVLDEKEMCDQYLKSNVFVCPSAIENSPNSLGEAQLLGVPYVCSYAGGMPEIVNYNNNVLYRYEEVETLAQKICEIFSCEGRYEQISFNKERYDGELNKSLLLGIYNSIASNL